jgi:3'-phosphoadenosine 5'-phosphosulfate sulfotransferase (PAPS reductase)/FAD synthetase
MKSRTYAGAALELRGTILDPETRQPRKPRNASELLAYREEVAAECGIRVVTACEAADDSAAMLALAAAIDRARELEATGTLYEIAALLDQAKVIRDGAAVLAQGF